MKQRKPDTKGHVLYDSTSGKRNLSGEKLDQCLPGPRGEVYFKESRGNWGVWWKCTTSWLRWWEHNSCYVSTHIKPNSTAFCRFVSKICILTFYRFFHRLVKTSSPTDTDLWVWREAGRTVSGYRITKGFFWMDGDWSMCIDRKEGGHFWEERPKPLEMGGGWLMERKDYNNQNSWCQTT